MKEQKVSLSSPNLLQFYKEWNVWADMAVETGQVPDHPAFDAWHGLCGCLAEWSYLQDHSTDGLGEQMEAQFIQAGLETDYPFGGRTTFFDEVDMDSMHLNSERRKWVKARISDSEAANG